VANIETSVITWLESVVGDWPVAGDKPDNPGEKFITIDRTGGPRESMVLDQAEILIEVYHKDSQVTASDKANEIADLIPQLKAYADNITHASVNSVVNLDDTIAQYYRYQIYCDIFNRR